MEKMFSLFLQLIHRLALLKHFTTFFTLLILLFYVSSRQKMIEGSFNHLTNDFVGAFLNTLHGQLPR